MNRNDDSIIMMNRLREADFPSEETKHPTERSLPVQVTKDDGVDRGVYAISLNQLLLAWSYEGEKEKLFGIHTPDQKVRDVIGDLLHVAITEIQAEGATACGLAFKLIDKAIDLHQSLSKHIYGPILWHARSPEEVDQEIACVTKTLERLQEELGNRKLTGPVDKDNDRCSGYRRLRAAIIFELFPLLARAR